MNRTVIFLITISIFSIPPDIDICRNLDKNQRKVLHAKNIWRLKSLDLGLDAAIDHECWSEAVEFGKGFIEGLKWVLILILIRNKSWPSKFFFFRYYTSEFNPLVGIAQLKIGKIYPHLNEFQSAIHHIREAGDVLKVTHGDQSRHMRDFVRPLLAETQFLLEESQRIQRPPSDDEDEEEEEGGKWVRK